MSLGQGRASTARPPALREANGARSGAREQLLARPPAKQAKNIRADRAQESIQGATGVVRWLRASVRGRAGPGVRARQSGERAPAAEQRHPEDRQASLER